MRKICFLVCFFSCINNVSASINLVDTKQDKAVPAVQKKIADPFDNDPFFQSQNDLLEQMHTMQKTMDRFIKNQFAQMHHSMMFNDDEPPFGSDKNIQIEEKNDLLIYKIKLPKGDKNKTNVTVKNNMLIVSLSLTQKISREQDHAKSVSYSQSNYHQSFPLPKGYDAKSMETKIKDTNLIVTFKKR